MVMSRKIVPLLTGEIYHVFNRGVDKREVFASKRDYLRFYQSLDLFNSIEPVINFDFALAHKKIFTNAERLVNIKAYSLLPNHIHLILKQNIDGGISEFMKRVSGGYTSYYNLDNDRSGALFQGTFKRVHVNSDEQYNYLLAYVNENHFVHNIKMEREICHSSSLHYKNISRSKLLYSVEQVDYSFKDAVFLANDIYLRRLKSKSSDTLE